MRVLHGSGIVLEKPKYKFGPTDNDYGQGFHTCVDRLPAHKWAVRFSPTKEAYINIYDQHMDGLKVLNLDKQEPLTTIAVISANRDFKDKITTPEGWEARRDFIDKYWVDTSEKVYEYTSESLDMEQLKTKPTDSEGAGGDFSGR